MIVIKDMEMPSSCYDCPFAKNKKTNDYGSFCECGLLEDYETINLLEHRKHPNCPLIEQEPRWIPTSERLPEEDGEYYATIYDTDENYKCMDIAEFEDGIWQYKDYIKVLAWMPLPKPYEPQESEDEKWHGQT